MLAGAKDTPEYENIMNRLLEINYKHQELEEDEQVTKSIKKSNNKIEADVSDNEADKDAKKKVSVVN